MKFLSKCQILFICFYIFSSVLLSTSLPFHNRIIGGELAQPGQFPYIVSIQEQIVAINYTGHYCGATIYNNKWVVTAAHCIQTANLEAYEIIAGTNLIDTGGIKYKVTKIIRHPEFNITVVWNDIALIEVDGEFDFTNPLIKTIDIGEVSGNELSTAVGWGTTEDEDTPSNELHFLEVIALSPEDCSTLARGSDYNDLLPRGPGHVCAFRSKGKAVCHGDSGSPLVYNNTFVGLVSHALDTTCANGFPDVFTRVAYYKNWIEETIAKYS